MTMARLRLYALTTVGGLCLVYEFVIEAMSPRGMSLSDLVWILIVVPMYAVGAWLTWRLPTHPQPVRLLVSGTAFVATGAFGSLIAAQPQMINSPWAPVLSTLSLEAQAVGSLAVALLIGGYPDGFVERSWQRLALRGSWVVLIGPPLALLASPVVPVSPFVAEDLAIPNPYAVSWLAWLAQPALWLAVNSWWVSVVGVLVLCARFVAADAAGRARMRVLFVVVVVGITLYAAGTVALALGAPDRLGLGRHSDQPRVADGDSPSGGDHLRDSAPPALRPGSRGPQVRRVRRCIVAHRGGLCGYRRRARHDAGQSGTGNSGCCRHHRCGPCLPAPPPATRICRQQKTVRRPRGAVPATEEPRHDDGADGRARRAAASTRARGPRRNRRELGTGPAV